MPKGESWRSLLVRPELAAAVGAAFLWLSFAILVGSPFLSPAGTAAYLNAAAPLGILAVAVSLLMIGGEFDLSIGSVLGAAGMSIMLLTTHFGWPLWPALAATLALCLAIGFVNGFIVVSTGLPSFIVTLGMLFTVRGLTIAVTRRVTGRTQLGGLDEASGFEAARLLFASSPLPPFRISILWWIGLTAVATWVLFRTRYGNWILGTGGRVRAARSLGVPVRRVKISLFMGTATAACLVASIQAIQFNGAETLRGTLQEFWAIAAAVIGGTLLKGGYGSAVGAALGALIFGLARQGIVMSGINADWFQVALGSLLIAAVLLNNRVHRLAVQR
ncbi:MAG: ABC transporter permease [Gemmatimonadota bacterium]